MIETALHLLAASALQSPDREPVRQSPTGAEIAPVIADREDARPLVPPAGGGPRDSRWFVRVGALRALYNSHARFTAYGQPIEGGSARVTDGTTLVVDVGYDLSDEVAVMLTGGFPPKADVLGEGTISSYGKLASVRFGTTVLTGVYRLPEWRGFRPYVGAGVAHIFILKTHDAAVKNLKAYDNNGFVLQAGLEYRVSRDWDLFADYKRLWLNIKSDGDLAGAPVRARVVLNPDVLSAGIKFHFR